MQGAPAMPQVLLDEIHMKGKYGKRKSLQLRSLHSTREKMNRNCVNKQIGKMVR
jgi:hypothetical protein